MKQTAMAALGAVPHPRRGTARLRAAHDEHQRSLRDVRAALEARGLAFSEVAPPRLASAGRRALARAELLVSVGGDGTLLGAVRHLRSGLALGVNSAPGDSVGHFCATDRRGFPLLLDRVLAGRAKEIRLARMEASLDGRPLFRRVLNDVLVAHAVPAATTRYEIALRARREIQRSSGIWVATPAGSTAGIRSAGGRALPLSSQSLQYRVRELYREPGRAYQLVGGLVGREGALEVVSRMPQGRLYADGARRVRCFPFGSRAVFRMGKEALRLVSRLPL